jgi:hypothetical protein
MRCSSSPRGRWRTRLLRMSLTRTRLPAADGHSQDRGQRRGQGGRNGLRARSAGRGSRETKQHSRLRRRPALLARIPSADAPENPRNGNTGGSVVRQLANSAVPVVTLGATSRAHEPSAFVEPSPQLAVEGAAKRRLGYRLDQTRRSGGRVLVTPRADAPNAIGASMAEKAKLDDVRAGGPVPVLRNLKRGSERQMNPHRRHPAVRFRRGR